MTTSWHSVAKNSSMQCESSAVIQTASSKGSEPQNTASGFPPKLGPTPAVTSRPSSATAHSASATQVSMNATWASSL